MASIGHWKRRVNRQLFSNPLLRESLSPAAVEEACCQAEHRWRSSFWSPSVALITFLVQVLDGAKTLRSAVALLLTQLAARGETEMPSADPTAYCQARQRRPQQQR